MKSLTTNSQFDQLLANKSDFIIFKNSATCSISGGACKEVYQAIDELQLDNIYKIEVLDSPELKIYVADVTGIRHESPQFLIFKKGVVTAHASHGSITKEWIRDNI